MAFLRSVDSFGLRFAYFVFFDYLWGGFCDLLLFLRLESFRGRFLYHLGYGETPPWVAPLQTSLPRLANRAHFSLGWWLDYYLLFHHRFWYLFLFCEKDCSLLFFPLLLLYFHYFRV